LVSAIAGTGVGLFYYYRYLAMYNSYKATSSFTNVAPSQSAMLFEDAGMLRFTAGTYPDNSRAVGYLSARRRETLCVAPVIDQRMTPAEEVSFFAAGVDCCHWRGYFACDDARVQGARSALLHFDAEQILSPLTAWLVDEDIDSEVFASAINLTQASFGLKVAKNVRLLRWAKDPLVLRDQMRRSALIGYSVASALFLGALAIAALYGAIGWKRIRKQIGGNIRQPTFHRHLQDDVGYGI
jgi:hypothetical protein